MNKENTKSFIEKTLRRPKSNRKSSIDNKQATIAEQNKHYFTKVDLVCILKSKGIAEVLACFLESSGSALGKEDRTALSQVICLVAETILDLLKNRQLYDKVSMKYIKSGVFPGLLNLYEQEKQLERREHR